MGRNPQIVAADGATPALKVGADLPVMDTRIGRQTRHLYEARQMLQALECQVTVLAALGA
jgi:hypothetical protein